ncbi:hypothetical protein FHW96_001896 [Novosphingobium sp. SG751A]|uniref:DUF6644 family protein n=1 Tax=Novosphingobium sp. SG751A TaxID=2587000 RepID=UPI001556C99B|nr:DUF6644 family protein [Novosphingobium sp. SG751A]NOW45738.1 hypothetical protein [Novosphingobium sp. SG751A]
MTLLVDFAAWLGTTSLSALVIGHDWLVPAIQVVHILAVAGVLIASLHIHLRALNVLERDVAQEQVAARFLPILWGALGVLAITGLLLIASEPTRAMFRTVFWVKLALVTAASVGTWAQGPLALRYNTGGVAVAPAQRVLAVASLLVWLAVIYAGRWIAYADAWAGAPA